MNNRHEGIRTLMEQGIPQDLAIKGWDLSILLLEDLTERMKKRMAEAELASEHDADVETLAQIIMMGSISERREAMQAALVMFTLGCKMEDMKERFDAKESQ